MGYMRSLSSLYFVQYFRICNIAKVHEKQILAHSFKIYNYNPEYTLKM